MTLPSSSSVRFTFSRTIITGGAAVVAVAAALGTGSTAAVEPDPNPIVVVDSVPIQNFTTLAIGSSLCLEFNFRNFRNGFLGATLPRPWFLEFHQNFFQFMNRFARLIVC
jgi:hypothetical protein